MLLNKYDSRYVLWKVQKNYKMYKAGKIWIFSSIIASSLAIGINTSVDNIHADGNVNKETAMSMKSTNDKLVQNIQNNITIPADYVKQAKDDGPFTAGVNQVIPFESFGGDGMLTRLLLKDAQMSPWSNNGTAMNQALLPVSGLEDGQYFYEVDLAGDLSGLKGQALIDKLSANGAKTYGATVKIYKAGADGKPDLTHTVAVKDDVKIAIGDKKDGSSSNNIMDSKNPDMNNSTMNSKDSATSDANSGMMNSKDSATSDMKMKEAAMLPSTGVNESKPLVLLGTLLLSIFSLFGLIMTRKNKAK